MLGRTADTAFLADHKEELRHFPDVRESDWFYAAVMEAANDHDFYYHSESGEHWTAVK